MFKGFFYALFPESRRLKEAGIMPPDKEETIYSRIFVIVVFIIFEIVVLYYGLVYEMPMLLIGVLTLGALVVTFVAGSICLRVYRFFVKTILETLFG